VELLYAFDAEIARWVGERCGDIAGEGRRYERVGVHEDQRVSLRGGGAGVHLAGEAARRHEQHPASRTRLVAAAIGAAAVDYN